MSPRELLHATMQAANEVRLPSWHNALIKTEAKLAILNTVSQGVCDSATRTEKTDCKTVNHTRIMNRISTI